MHSYIKGLVRREGASKGDKEERVSRQEEISAVSRRHEERGYQEEKGISTFNSVADVFSDMEITSYFREFWRPKSEFKRKSRGGIKDNTYRQLFLQVLLQRAAKILRVICLHYKNLDNIKSIKEKKITCNPAVWKQSQSTFWYRFFWSFSILRSSLLNWDEAIIYGYFPNYSPCMP